MPARPGTRRSSNAATIASVQRHHGADDPRLIELRRDSRVFALDEHIRAVVASWPPPTPEQFRMLRELLPPVDFDAGALAS